MLFNNKVVNSKSCSLIKDTIVFVGFTKSFFHFPFLTVCFEEVWSALVHWEVFFFFFFVSILQGVLKGVFILKRYTHLLWPGWELILKIWMEKCSSWSTSLLAHPPNCSLRWLRRPYLTIAKFLLGKIWENGHLGSGTWKKPKICTPLVAFDL